MDMSGRNRSATEGKLLSDVFVLVIAVFGALTFHVLRRGRRLWSREYYPVSYDQPQSGNPLVKFFQSLNTLQRFQSLILLFTLASGIVLLPAIFANASPSQGTYQLLLVFLLALLGVAYWNLFDKSFTVVYVGLAIALLFRPDIRFISELSVLIVITFAATGLLQLFLNTQNMLERYDDYFEVAAVSALILSLISAVGVQNGSSAYGIFVAVIAIVTVFLLLIIYAYPVTNAIRFYTKFSLLILSVVVALLTSIKITTSEVNLVTAVGALAVLLSISYQKARSTKLGILVAPFLGQPKEDTPLLQNLTILPPKREHAPAHAAAMVAGILGITDQIRFGITAKAGEGISWQIVTDQPRDLLSKVEQEVLSHAAGSITFEPKSVKLESLPIFRQLILFGLANEYAAPLPFVEELANHDPLSILTERMSLIETQASERLNYEIIVTTATNEARNVAIRRLQKGKIRPLSSIFYDPDRPLDGLDKIRIRTKLEQPGEQFYHCFVALILESPKQERLPLLSQAVRDIEQFYSPGHNRLVAVLKTQPYQVEKPDLLTEADVLRLLDQLKRNKSNFWRDALCVLSIPEIAALWHLPLTVYEAPEVSWAQSRIPEEMFDQANGVLLGKAITPGVRDKAVYLKSTDRTTSHYIAGKPGTGKSTLMHQLIHADIQAGHGVGVIDPQGTLVADVIKNSIPANRKNDIVLLEARRADFPVALNPFRRPPQTSLLEAYNYSLFALEKIYENIWLEGQTASYLRQALQLLLTDPDATPLDIRRIFTNDEYRNSLLANIESENVATELPIYSMRAFWQEYENLKGGEQSKILAPIITRTDVFTQTARLQYMTCHPDYFDYKGMIRNKKIVLIDLSGDELVNDVNNLSTLFVTGFFLGANSLGRIPNDHPPRFYLYVDEIERVVTAPFTHILSESRKYGLTSILANQYLDQMPQSLLKGILGTVGTTSVFQLGIEDARLIARQFEPELSSTELMNLDLWHMAVKTRRGPRSLPPMILKTEKPLPVEEGVAIEELRRQTEQGLRPVSDVKAWLDARYRPKPLQDSAPVESPRAKNTPSTKPSWLTNPNTVSDIEPPDSEENN